MLALVPRAGLGVLIAMLGFPVYWLWKGRLLAALIDEHRPAGMTERHLIEELATIIWRKRRVLLAEGARINEGLKSAANSSKSVMFDLLCHFSVAWLDENTDVRDQHMY